MGGVSRSGGAAAPGGGAPGASHRREASIAADRCRLQRLLEASADALARLPFPEALRVLLTTAVIAARARRGTLTITEEGHVVAAVSYPESHESLTFRSREGDASESEAHLPARQPRGSRSLRRFQGGAAAGRRELHASMAVGGGRGATLTISSPISEDSFSRADEEMLGEVASLAGAVLRSRERHRHDPAESRELDLRNIGLALSSSLQLEETLQMVAGMTVEMMSAQLCLILSFQEQDAALPVLAACSSDGAPVQASVNLGEGSLAARIIETGQPAWREDGVDRPRLYPVELNPSHQVRAGIGVPLRSGDRVTGVIMSYHAHPRGYTADEVQVLAAIARQASAAIHRCGLYERQRGIAETIRRSLAPSLPSRMGRVDVGHVYLPCADGVGGDYYDITPYPDGRLGIVIGDVSGSGLAAAVHTSMGKYMARAFAFEAMQPGVVLQKLNDAICVHSTSDVYLTLFFGTLHPSGLLQYANGAHPYPIVRRASRGTVNLLETTGTVVGILPHQEYHERETCLRIGDILLLYTDGVIEAQRGGEQFGLERLQAMARHWQGDHPQELVDSIGRTVQQYSGRPLRDDVALLAIRMP